MHFPYILAVVVMACGGIPKGYDEGGFSASVKLDSFLHEYALDTDYYTNHETAFNNITANITSFGVLGTAFGALIALVLSDRFGRLRCWQGFVVLWASGIFMQIFASGFIGLLYFARIWLGFGSGGLTVVSPMYLSEISPTRSRGMAVSVFMVFLLSFLSIGFFINYGASIGMAATPSQFQLVQAIPLIPVGIAFLGSFYLKESPRWLQAKDRTEDAMKSLSHFRGLDARSEAIRAEAEEIHESLSMQSQTLKNIPIGTRIKEAVSIPTYRRRLLLALTMQTVAQWSGGNGITYYITNIFADAGIGDTGTQLIAGGAYGLVKLVFTMVFAWGLVDYFGRRPCFIGGVLLQLIAHTYLLFFSRFANQNNNATQATSGVAIFAVFVYAVGWSIGLCTVQYIYGTEIFPTRIRGICYAFNMALHWFFQFAVVRVVPIMMPALHVWGGFLFFAIVCAIGLVILFLMAPETNRVPMEEMDDLFAGPWYTGWKAKVDPSRHRNRDFVDDEKRRVENRVEDLGHATPTERTKDNRSFFE